MASSWLHPVVAQRFRVPPAAAILRLVSDTVCKIETPNPNCLKQCCVTATNCNRRIAVDVDVDLPASRRPDANARICSNARGRHGRVGEELAAGMNENAPPTGKRAAGLSNKGWGVCLLPTRLHFADFGVRIGTAGCKSTLVT